jgi:glutaconate CoA-transferase subunit A
MAALQAGAAGLPFMPVVGHVGSDYERLRPDFKVIADPYSGRPVMVVPPIRPDLSLIHGAAADPEGNVLTEEKEDDFLLAPASGIVIASAERIVSHEGLRRMPYGLLVPGIHVTAVVHVPGGAHPTAVRAHYPLDEPHLLEYIEAARSDESFKPYLDRYVFGPRDHAAYLELVRLTPPA